MNHLKKILFIIVVFLAGNPIRAQYNKAANSRNGKTLPCHGTLRILVIYAEMEYDVNPDKDPCKITGFENWRAHQLPKWKDELLSHDTTDLKKGKLTNFFAESSFNDYKVLGDYYPKVITIKESEVKNAADGAYHVTKIIEKINADSSFTTMHGNTIEDFDLVTLTDPGMPKISPSTDKPIKIDHVMFILRNLVNLPDGNGRAVPGNCGNIAGCAASSFSTFGAHNGMPFGIAKHEYVHLFFGDNNFHSGGGGEKFGNGTYQMGIQHMWSVISSAFASLMTCNAWDRHRLGWKAPGKENYISCLSEQKTEVNTDFKASENSEGTYLLRDFVNTGDAIRLQLPYIPGNQYAQYLWIENHQATQKNGSLFDKFQFEEDGCRERAKPGLYMYLQIDKDQLEGGNLYGGFAEYLRPLPARGSYDYLIDTNKVQNNCINDVYYKPFTIEQDYSNPLTGTHQLEDPILNLNMDASINVPDLVYANVQKQGDTIIRNLPNFGSATVPFNYYTKTKIGIGTNPSTAPTYTATVSDFGANRRQQLHTAYLNGISIDMLKQEMDGSIKIKIRNHDYTIENDVRWCADTIMFPVDANEQNPVILAAGKSMQITRGLTPTRAIKPDTVNGQFVFTSASVAIIPAGGKFVLQENANLLLDKKSKLILMPGSQLVLEKGASLKTKEDAQLIIQDATVVLKQKATITIKGRQNLTLQGNGKINSTSKKQVKIK
ncbi:MAG: hypothetical protein IPO27_15175 [Bacteroidetes bacterium]|nr:hypothetical protein [Bacteroidota bacterium]